MRKGYSLVEVLFVVVILGILTGSLAGPFRRLSLKYQLRLAVWTVHSRLNAARYRAVFTGIKHRVVFGTDRVTLETYDGTADDWKRKAVYFVQGVNIQANNSPVFFPQGTVANLATIKITNGWGGYKITLAISGRIKAAPL
jgi:prepilin-type N-terminal cleavage/methylation domain-containing protein